MPLSRVGSTLTIAMTDPTNVFAMDDIKFMTGFNVEPVVASESAISEAIHKFYGDVESVEELDKVMKDLAGDEASLELSAEEQEMDLATLEKAAEEAPIIKLVNLILTDAVKRGASDIHVEPYEKELRVRFRVDGVLQNVMAPPLKLKDAITSRMKIMSKLDISEKRLAARRPHHDQVFERREEERTRLPCFYRSNTFRRKNRFAVVGQRKPAAGYDQAGFRTGVADEVRAADSETLRNGAGDWADRFGKNEHAVFVGRAAEYG